ncbi:nucleoid-associated protein [Pragia fontium]|uniref:nucleoid-associated protein n=1 Tax=Pragia fontium TaxID=82985 RepID=UPI000649774F|nr:nucleoid-associated protein [Pragia fontium]AKJ41258.1 hypothetical protein QQ39_03485 [Pragia fontium]
MNFLKLQIDKIAIHQIFARGDDRKEISPVKGTELIRFDEVAMNDFKRRIIDALGNASSAVRMKIAEQGKDKTPHCINKLLGCDDNSFINTTYEIAKNLTTAQSRKGMSGGILVVFSANYNPEKLPLIGIIKADIHSGYEKFQDKKTGLISLNHVEEILLTPSTRLYKSAGFFFRADSKKTEDLNDQWVVEISDYQIDKSDGKAAAQYFYRAFLGCEYPETSARTTKRYFELTSDFINNMDIEEEERNELHNALFSDLKTKKSQRVDPLKFAEDFMSIEDVDDFRNYLEDSDFSVESFIKNTEHITSKLKNRRVKFSKDIRITAPSEIFEEFITIETIAGDKEKDGYEPTWTKILIKDRIMKQQ